MRVVPPEKNGCDDIREKLVLGNVKRACQLAGKKINVTPLRLVRSRNYGKVDVTSPGKVNVGSRRENFTSQWESEFKSPGKTRFHVTRKASITLPRGNNCDFEVYQLGREPWWLPLRLRGFGEYVRPFIPRLCYIFFL